MHCHNRELLSSRRRLLYGFILEIRELLNDEGHTTPNICPLCVVTSFNTQNLYAVSIKTLTGNGTRFIELSLDLSLKIYIFGMGYIDPSPFHLEWHLEVEKCLFLPLIQFGLLTWLVFVVRLGGFESPLY